MPLIPSTDRARLRSRLRPRLGAAGCAAALGLVLLSGCGAPAASTDQAGQAGSGSAPATEESAGQPAPAERPEGLDASLPVPPGTLISATQETSAWAYVYGDVTTDEARDFAEGFRDAGYDLKVTVDSDGVQQWYFQSSEWAVKLEQTHDSSQLYYWVDPMSA